MKIIVRPSANKDVKKIPGAIKADIERVVLQLIEAESLEHIPNLKKLKGNNKAAYRIRIKDYRLGFFLEGDTIIVSRILHRKEVYRYFP